MSNDRLWEDSLSEYHNIKVKKKYPFWYETCFNKDQSWA